MSKKPGLEGWIILVVFLFIFIWTFLSVIAELIYVFQNIGAYLMIALIFLVSIGCYFYVPRFWAKEPKVTPKKESQRSVQRTKELQEEKEEERRQILKHKDELRIEKDKHEAELKKDIIKEEKEEERRQILKHKDELRIEKDKHEAELKKDIIKEDKEQYFKEYLLEIKKLLYKETINTNQHIRKSDMYFLSFEPFPPIIGFMYKDVSYKYWAWQISKTTNCPYGKILIGPKAPKPFWTALNREYSLDTTPSNLVKYILNDLDDKFYIDILIKKELHENELRIEKENLEEELRIEKHKEELEKGKVTDPKIQKYNETILEIYNLLHKETINTNQNHNNSDISLSALKDENIYWIGFKYKNQPYKFHFKLSTVAKLDWGKFIKVYLSNKIGRPIEYIGQYPFDETAILIVERILGYLDGEDLAYHNNKLIKIEKKIIKIKTKEDELRIEKNKVALIKLAERVHKKISEEGLIPIKQRADSRKNFREKILEVEKLLCEETKISNKGETYTLLTTNHLNFTIGFVYNDNKYKFEFKYEYDPTDSLDKHILVFPIGENIDEYFLELREEYSMDTTPSRIVKDIIKNLDDKNYQAIIKKLEQHPNYPGF